MKMKRICYGFILGMLIITIGVQTNVVSADGGSLGSKSDVTFYGTYEYPQDQETEQQGSQPAELTPDRPINNNNNHAIIPQLGDVDTGTISLIGMLVISLAIILGKRKVRINEN